MKPKSNTAAANVAFAAAAALAGTIATFKVDPAIDSSKAELLAPATVEAGALTIFSAQGSDVQWDIYPEIPSQPFGEQHTSLATSFQYPGDYLVVCSWLDGNGEVQLRKHPIKVERLGSPPVPKPKPEDDSAPVIKPEDTGSERFGEVAALVNSICVDGNAPKAKCCELSSNFSSISEKIRAGHYETIAGVLRDTSVLNRKTGPIDDITTALQLIVSRKRFDGELGDVDAYADLWEQIARGLSSYGQCN